MLTARAIPYAIAFIVDDLTVATPTHHQEHDLSFFRTLAAIITLLRAALRLEVVPKKSFVFQLSVPRHLSVITHRAHLPQDFRLRAVAYRLAGGPIGTLEAAHNSY